MPTDDQRTTDEKLQKLEARMSAMSELITTLLTALRLRGLLSQPEIDAVLREAASAVSSAASEAGTEIDSVRAGLPAHLRAAMGPEPDEDDHDH